MVCQQIEPLPGAGDPQRRPALPGLKQPLTLLPIGAGEFVGARWGVVLDGMHLDPGDRSLSDGSDQAFSFFLVHLYPLSPSGSSDEALSWVQPAQVFASANTRGKCDLGWRAPSPQP